MSIKTGYFNAILSDQGRPVLASVSIYAAGSSTIVTIWADRLGTIQKDNPFQTDSLGRFQFFTNPGYYDIEIYGSGITTFKIENVYISSVISMERLYNLESILQEGMRMGSGEDFGKTPWADLGQQFSQQAIRSLAYLGNGVALAGTGDTTGKILRSTDYGATWADLGQQFSQTHIYSLAYLGNGVVLAGTYPLGKILRSTDYGATWADLGQQFSQTYILSLVYLGNGVALAGTGTTGRILRSADYGATWANLGQQFSQSYILSLVYLGNGVALAGTGVGGKILRSTDYGATWADLGQQFSQTYIRSLAYLGNGVALAGTGAGGRILRHRNWM